MNEIRYMISDASKQVEVEAHVLRYWEEELDLQISRNEMGHRYYTKADIERFKSIKIMKDKGYQLKAIKMELLGEGNMTTVALQPQVEIKEQREETMQEESKGEKARNLLKNIIAEVVEEKNMMLLQYLDENVGNKVIKQMDYLFREQEERDEEQYKKFDELLREQQNGLRLKKNKVKKEEKDNIHKFKTEPVKEKKVFRIFGKERTVKS